MSAVFHKSTDELLQSGIVKAEPLSMALWALWSPFTVTLEMCSVSLKWTHGFLSDGTWIPGVFGVFSLYHRRGRGYTQLTFEVLAFTFTGLFLSLVFLVYSNSLFSLSQLYL